MTKPLTGQQPEREQVRRAIAEAGGWTFEDLEPHDFQAETTAVMALMQRQDGEARFWEFEYREAMDNYRGEAQHATNLRAELEQARTEPDRPSPDHQAVYVDQHNQSVWCDYLTLPPGDDVVPLVYAHEVAESKADLEARGITLRVIGWVE